MKEFNSGAELVKLRKKETKDCSVCGQEWTKLAGWKYCSNRCRQKAKYARSKPIQVAVRPNTAK